MIAGGSSVGATSGGGAGGGGGGGATASCARRPRAASFIEPEQSRTNTTSWASSSGIPKNSTTGAPTSATAGAGADTRTSVRTFADRAMVIRGGGRTSVVHAVLTMHAVLTTSGKLSDDGRMTSGTPPGGRRSRDHARVGRAGVASRALTARSLTIAAALASGACVRQLAPAPTPDAVPPPEAAALASAPADGQGRLVVDVVDGPTPVQRMYVGSEPEAEPSGRVHYRLFEQAQPLCPASPCVLAVPPGNIALGFPVIGDRGALEIELVHVAAGTSVYRRRLSQYEDRTGALRTLGILGTAIGGAAMVTGAVLLPIGLGKDHDGLTTSGGISLGVGAALTAFGIWAIRKDAPTFRPGASIHF